MKYMIMLYGSQQDYDVLMAHCKRVMSG